MKLRYPLIAGGVAVVAIAAVYMLPSKVEEQPTREKATKKAAARAGTTPSLEAPADPKQPVKMVMTESGLRPQSTRKVPKTWKDPVSGATFREVLDAVPDPEGAAREELVYRKQRLRLTLADAAASCYKGNDSRDEIDLDYTLVVEEQIVHTENVRVKSSNIKDPTVERCIVDAVRDLRSFADKVPNLREEQSQFMSLHELYDRNRRDQKEDKPPTPDSDPVAKQAK